MCIGFGAKFPSTGGYLTDGYLTTRARALWLGFRLPDRRTSDSWVRPRRADGTQPRVRLWLTKTSAARPAGSRPRADAIRRAAERSRRAAERGCRTERPRSRALIYLLTGVFSAATSGIFVRRPAASAGGLLASPRADPRPLSRRVPELLSVLQRICLRTTSRSPLTSSTLNVRLSIVFYRKYVHQDLRHSHQILLHAHQAPLHLWSCTPKYVRHWHELSVQDTAKLHTKILRFGSLSQEGLIYRAWNFLKIHTCKIRSGPVWVKLDLKTDSVDVWSFGM